MAERRAAALEHLDSLAFPTFEDEVWRYSPIDDFDLDSYGLAAPPDDGAAAGALDGFDEVAGAIVTVDGAIVEVRLDDALAAKGVTLGPAAEIDEADRVVGAAMPRATDYFAALNEAFVAAPVVLAVPDGVVVDRPVVVVNLVRSPEVAVFTRCAVVAGPASEVTVVEVNRSEDVASVFAPVTELVAGASARLDYVQIQDLGPRMWQLGNEVISIAQQATVRSWVGAFGGDYARLRTDCRLEGRGAHGDLLAAYFGSGDQTLDFRTFQDHIGADTTSNLLFKGVLDDRSRSIYTGLIHVGPDARGTNAFQTNRNIKLSEDAWAESVPNLEIENNDVRCSHASTVGPVDEDQLFYLESRGVPGDVAERLLVAGFFDEVLSAIGVDAATAIVDGLVHAKLDAEENAKLDAKLDAEENAEENADVR